jgi:uncharacterized membrane protein
MTRLLYRLLLRLHPPRFRERFSAEMLCVFDELAAERGGLSLLADAMGSLGRQWFLGFGLWKAIIAIVLAMIPVIIVLHGVGRQQRRWIGKTPSRPAGQTLPVHPSRRNGIRP